LSGIFLKIKMSAEEEAVLVDVAVAAKVAAVPENYQ